MARLVKIVTRPLLTALVIKCRFMLTVCSEKWVYRPKNWPRKKFGWSTFHFRVVIYDPIAASS